MFIFFSHFVAIHSLPFFRYCIHSHSFHTIQHNINKWSSLHIPINQCQILGRNRETARQENKKRWEKKKNRMRKKNELFSKDYMFTLLHRSDGFHSKAFTLHCTRNQYKYNGKFSVENFSFTSCLKCIIRKSKILLHTQYLPTQKLSWCFIVL